MEAFLSVFRKKSTAKQAHSGVCLKNPFRRPYPTLSVMDTPDSGCIACYPQ